MIKTDVKNNLVGKVFGRWTVLDDYKSNEKGARMWKCRCECGEERYVLAKSLKSGKSQSCGCLNREIVKERAEDLTGQLFGDLKVINKAIPKSNQKDVYWLCQCSCGNMCTVDTYRLKNNIKTHCGCKTKHNHTKKDITNMHFDRLTALYETDKRDKNGSVVWHCICDCGIETDISYNNLVYGTVISCGCIYRENSKLLHTYVTRVAGTSVDLLRRKNKEIYSNTGIRGVYQMKNGKFRAEITFQKKVYRLGTYTDFDAAKQARIRAEEQLHNAFIEYYKKWEKKAASDPIWAEENPVIVEVVRLDIDEFELIFSPDI